MLPYILLFLLLLIFVTFDKKENEEPNYFWYYILFITTSIFSGLRDMIGGYDIFIYGQVYEATVTQILNYKAFEKGFELYFVFLKNFNQDRQFMFFITAFLISLLHFRVLKKYSPLLYFSLFILFCKFYLMSFVYLRQFLSMGIIWLSIPYILDKKILKTFFFVLLAFFFHKSSIIFLPIIFLSKTKFNNLNLFLIIVLVIIIGVSPLSHFFISSLSERINDNKISKYAEVNNSINILYLLETIVYTVLLLKFKADFYKTKIGTLTLNSVFIYILVNTLSLINASFIRFGWYYYIFVVLFLTNVYTFIEEKKNRNLYKFIVILYFALTFFRLLINWDMGDMMPYKTIYQNFYRPHLYDHFEYRPRKY